MTARDARPLSARLEALGQAIVAAKQRAGNAELAHNRASADVTRLRDAVIDAHAEGNDARAAKASKERDKVEGTTLRDAAERLEGARRAVARAEAEHGLFARENADGILSEYQPDAVAAAQGVEHGVEQVVQLYGQWSAVATKISSFLRLAGRDSREMPSFPAELERLVRDARRAGGVHVPPPVPGGESMVPVPLAPAVPASLPMLDREQKPPQEREAA